jgi:multidrug efflux system outer membrane protein
MIRRAGALATTALIVAGCAIGPDYERPALPTPDAHRGVLSPQDAASLADLGWAEVFGDPELRTVLEIAIANNLDLQLAAARVEEFRGRSRVARSYLGPEVRGVGNTAPSPGSSEDSSYSLGFSLSWEIDLFGRLRRSSEAARAQLLASEDAARGVMTALVADVATTWFRLRELDTEVSIIERTIKSQEDTLALVRSLKRNGVASGTEEQQAISQLAGTRAQLPLALQRRVQTENLLRFLMGYAPEPVQRSAVPAVPWVPAELPVGLPAQLLERRPDLRQAENELHAATASVGFAEASRFPYLSIGLTSFLGILSPELSRLLDGDDPAESLFSIGPFLDMPLYQSGRGTGNVEVARAQLRQAEFAYRRGVLGAYRETADALVVTNTVRDSIEQAAIREGAAREVLRLQLLRYRSGVVSYLEVLDAERQLFNAELEHSRARLNRLEAYVELYRALGGGWSDAELGRLTKLSPPR